MEETLELGLGVESEAESASSSWMRKASSRSETATEAERSSRWCAAIKMSSRSSSLVFAINGDTKREKETKKKSDRK